MISRAELGQISVVQDALAEAAEQARRYRAGLVERFGAILRLRCWAVVAVGLERLVACEVEGG